MESASTSRGPDETEGTRPPITCDASSGIADEGRSESGAAPEGRTLMAALSRGVVAGVACA
eukprot:6268549-Prymnesium_polylepis.1